ncbi:MAG: C10 family peptidase [Bacteroidales bacterium]|nr:C10 family peptidase [Bacteroidales bacterium]
MEYIKKIILIIILSLLITACQKEEIYLNQKASNKFVSKEKAINIAQNFLNKTSFKDKQIKKYSNSSIDTVYTISDNGITLLYIIVYKKGYVIHSASKKEYPILAYSGNSQFDINNLAPGLKIWLTSRKEKIKKYINEDIEEEKEVKEIWDAVAPPEGDEEIIYTGSVEIQVGPLLPTFWGQGDRYNDFCEDLGCQSTDNGRAPTGCVATATAQIMCYWEYPNTYDWNIMPVGGLFWFNAATNGTEEIAQLMLDIGYAVDMNYNCGGSSAYTSDIIDVLENTFGYSTNASYTNYNATTLISQLNIGHPVIMRGEDINAGGHAWVCEGYQRLKYTYIHNPGTIYEYETYTYSSPFFRMNWGWNGDYNAWYLYNNFDPSSYNFNNNLKMIVNIYP